MNGSASFLISLLQWTLTSKKARLRNLGSSSLTLLLSHLLLGWFLLLFWNKSSLCSLGWPGTYSNSYAPASWLLGLQPCDLVGACNWSTSVGWDEGVSSGTSLLHQFVMHLSIGSQWVLYLCVLIPFQSITSSGLWAISKVPKELCNKSCELHFSHSLNLGSKTGWKESSGLYVWLATWLFHVMLGLLSNCLDQVHIWMLDDNTFLAFQHIQSPGPHSDVG